MTHPNSNQEHDPTCSNNQLEQIKNFANPIMDYTNFDQEIICSNIANIFAGKNLVAFAPDTFDLFVKCVAELARIFPQCASEYLVSKDYGIKVSPRLESSGRIDNSKIQTGVDFQVTQTLETEQGSVKVSLTFFGRTFWKEDSWSLLTANEKAIAGNNNSFIRIASPKITYDLSDIAINYREEVIKKLGIDITADSAQSRINLGR
ncbi:MAG: hypothetical protein KIT27_04180 [Legionellales bacterium]|nr:hypothetical protein [Legionellales bacterium]